MAAELFYLAITENSDMVLYKSLEELAFDGDELNVKNVLAVPIDIHSARKMNNTAAEAMLDLFNARGETDIARAPEFALRFLREEFEEAAVYNFNENERLAKEETNHIRQELDNLYTL